MKPNGQELRLLVVEDCVDDFDLLLLKLSEAGFNPRATRVDTIAEIEQELSQGDWQMVVSDFDLPGFNGLRALELVRRHHAELPFFLVSGIADEAQAVAAMRAGAQDYFFKGKLQRLGPAISRELMEAEKRAERRSAKAELERDRNLLKHDRIRFVDVMSHELRTPLNIINVAAGLLQRYGARLDAEGRQERLVEIQDAVARMMRTIDRVLLTSQLELRHWDLRSDTFNLTSWCDEFIQQTLGGEQRRRLRLTLRSVPDQVAMDQRVIEIALQNLLSNAMKYSPPEVPVELEIDGSVPGWVSFHVVDRGIGIPAEELPRIFGSFFRASNVGDVLGTGLGLALVKSCADLHGGTLTVESELGKGTSILLTLPDWLEQRNSPGPEAPAVEVTAGCKEY